MNGFHEILQSLTEKCEMLLSLNQDLMLVSKMGCNEESEDELICKSVIKGHQDIKITKEDFSNQAVSGAGQKKGLGKPFMMPPNPLRKNKVKASSQACKAKSVGIFKNSGGSGTLTPASTPTYFHEHVMSSSSSSSSSSLNSSEISDEFCKDIVMVEVLHSDNDTVKVGNKMVEDQSDSEISALDPESEDDEEYNIRKRKPRNACSSISRGGHTKP